MKHKKAQDYYGLKPQFGSMYLLGGTYKKEEKKHGHIVQSLTLPPQTFPRQGLVTLACPGVTLPQWLFSKQYCISSYL